MFAVDGDVLAGFRRGAGWEKCSAIMGIWFDLLGCVFVLYLVVPPGSMGEPLFDEGIQPMHFSFNSRRRATQSLSAALVGSHVQTRQAGRP